MTRYTRERWIRLSALLADALECPPDERRSFLDNACSDDSTLVAEVEALLDAHQAAEASHRFEGNALDLAPSALDDAVAPPAIGNYNLVREIGRGGMSTVWLAERADGLYEQFVAVKLFRAGFLPDSQRKRFEVERRILASLEHPNIARLLDGGVTDSGQPFLVMEYIDGRTITEFCRESRLGIKERLDLFRDVCETVSFAHQNLVVHRDLKPSNILVTADGVVKLLDFGIAKLLDEDLTADSDPPLTQTGQIVMTPEYAAPEQILGNAITTATDVYALGIVLYELLVGKRPYAIDDRSPVGLGRIIAEANPTKPSSAIRTQEGTSSATGTPSTTERLARRLKGDLDTIVLKAIRKEPDRRYGTAADLAEDLLRFEQGLPVRAQPDTAGYRVSKFVGRHRAGLGATLLLLLVVAAGFISTRHQARIAKTEAAKSDAINEYLLGMLAASDPTQEGADVRVSELLDRAVNDLDTRFEEQPEVEAALRHTLGRVYTELGLYGEADALVEEAYRMRRESLGPAHRETLLSQSLLGRINVLEGEYDRADSVLTETLRIAESALNPTDSLFVDLYGNLGYAAYVLGDLEASERHHRAVVTALERQIPPNRVEIAASLGNVAIVLADAGKLEEATGMLERQVDIVRDELGPGNPRLGRALANLGTVYFDRFMGDDAVRVLSEAVEIFQNTLGPEASETGWALGNLGSGLTLLDRDEDAADAFTESLAIYRETLGTDHPRTASATLRLARHLHNVGRTAEARPLALEALTIWRASLPDDHPTLAEALDLLGEMALSQKDYTAAEPFLREAYSVRLAGLPSDHPDIFESQSALGACLGHLGRSEEAEALLRSGYESLVEVAGKGHEATSSARDRLSAFCLVNACEVNPMSDS